MRSVPIVLGGLLLAGTALGQSSPSFKLEEHAFNAGGTPAQGVELKLGQLQHHARELSGEKPTEEASR